MPTSLRTATRGETPSRASLRHILFKESQAVGLARDFSRTEEDVLTFVFEAFQNALEHGQPKAVTPGGFYGLVLERVNVSHQSLPTTNRDSSALHKYIQRIQGRSARTTTILSYTVADNGPGIQNTIPTNNDETPQMRILRSFKPGVTSKKALGHEKGLGLTRILESASRLGAYLSLTSAGLHFHADWADSKSEPPTSKLAKVLYQGVTHPRFAGTSLTIAFPVSRDNADQLSLRGI